MSRAGRAAAAALLLLGACGPAARDEAGPSSAPASPPAATPPPVAAEPTGFLAEENLRVIVLFFPSDDARALVPERRTIFETNTLSSLVQQVVSELLLGPQGESPAVAPFPPGTELLGIFLLPDGTAVVNLGAEATGIPAGSAAEVAAVYSLVDSVTFNFAEISRVQIIIEGEEIPTLAGHLDTGRPIHPDLRRVDWGASGPPAQPATSPTIVDATPSDEDGGAPGVEAAGEEAPAEQGPGAADGGAAAGGDDAAAEPPGKDGAGRAAPAMEASADHGGIRPGASRGSGASSGGPVQA